MIDVSGLNFEKSNGLIPCIVQDVATSKVLMLGFMNEEALIKTINERKVTFFSRSKDRLWTKGETSGNFLTPAEILPDCDKDTLLIKAVPSGPVCHKGYDTCFNERNESSDLSFLETIITDRKLNPREGSYTSELFGSGINKIAQKVGEEAVELVIEAKDNDSKKFVDEAADLLYHYLVLLSAKEKTLKEVVSELRSRHKPD
jgi:phosphoribosyl-ATP pyrophosphohydrolase/phosphoribosyl-AMP cyclohydrolase